MTIPERLTYIFDAATSVLLLQVLDWTHELGLLFEDTTRILQFVVTAIALYKALYNPTKTRIKNPFKKNPKKNG